MFSLLSVLPVVGPIIQGIVDVFNKRSDVDLQKTLSANQTALGKQVDTNKTDVAIIQERGAIVLAFKDDLGVRLLRDLVMFFPSAWMAWYFANLIYPFAGPVATPPETMQYIPYAIIAFLFATNFRGK